MNTTNGVNGTSSAAGIDAAYLPAASTVSPEAFLAMLKARLNDFDSQIENISDIMSERFAQQEALRSDQRKLEMLKNLGAEEGDDDIKGEKIRYNNQEYTLQEFLDLPENASLKERLPCLETEEVSALSEVADQVFGNDDGLSAIIESVGGDRSVRTRVKNEMRGEDIQQAIDDIEKSMSGHKRSDEVQMVTLQTLIQERGSSVQLVSNLIASMNEANKSIIANMRS